MYRFKVFLVLGNLLQAGLRMPLMAPLVSDRSEAEAYCLRYGRLAPCCVHQVLTAESGIILRVSLRPDDQERIVGMANDFLGGASEHPASDARVAVGAHGDQAVRRALGEFDDGFCRIAFSGDN